MYKDKQIEKERYDVFAKSLYAQSDVDGKITYGSKGVNIAFRTPYIYYEKQLEALITSKEKILEIASGTGFNTEFLLKKIKRNAQVYATDISSESLNVLKARFINFPGLLVQVADMESLPFPENSMDIVSCAGSLSYGDNRIVMNEIYRVLKPGGAFVCVDSLNNNFIYKLNRWFQYFSGKRSFSTIDQMPTINLIDQYKKKFSRVELKYFQGFIFLYPLLSRFFSDHRLEYLFQYLDMIFKVKKSAFKFTMVAYK